jgi:tRNA A-37 threonylcarbamoyl transferase component Bud32
MVYSGFWMGSSIFVTYFYLLADLIASLSNLIMTIIVSKTSLSKYMPPYLYFSVLIFCVVTFGTLRQFIPLFGFWNYLSEITLFIVFAAKWFVVALVMVFLFSPVEDKPKMKRSLKLTLFSSVLALIVALLTWYFGDDIMRWFGVLLVEALIVFGCWIISLLFVATWCSSGFKFSTPRPATFLWSFFQAIVHTIIVFKIIFTMLQRVAVAACLDFVATSIFSFFLAFVLYFVFVHDTTYLRTQYALIQKEKLPDLNSELIETIPHSLQPIQKLVQDGVEVIPWSSLKIQSFIGRGHASDVYLGVWKKRKVAIKKLRIPSDLNEEKNLLEDLVKECTILSRLRHPNILCLLGLCTTPPNLAIVTEFMSRGALWNVLHPNGPTSTIPPRELKWSIRLKIMKEVAKGMNFLHKLTPPIIHRDLKSHNVLLDEDWNCKVADFGMSRVKNLTEKMTRVGTPQWMAPEVLRQERYSEKADVWSFGVLIWELVTLQAPFLQYTPLQVISLVAHQGKKLQIPEHCPKILADIMKRCWIGAEQFRLRPSFEQILNVLEQIDPADLEISNPL